MKPGSLFPGRFRKVLRLLLLAFSILAVAFVLRCWYAFRDRSPGYQLDLTIDGSVARHDPKPLRVGFGRVRINPDLGRSSEPIWLAGFRQKRAATGIHDDLWAVACVVDDGHSRLALAALDSIGFFHDDAVKVRNRIPRDWDLDYTVVCSTHNHSTPDLIGLWGPSYLRTGVNAGYREQVVAATVQAFGQAVASLQPASVVFHRIPTPPAGLLADTRKPEVYDSDIRVIHFKRPENGVTLGSIVSWANHPETVWAGNTEITADFPGYLRAGLEQGVWEGDRLLDPGEGGLHLYINGAIGGLMSTTPDIEVRDPYLGKSLREPSHEKTRALGRQLVHRVLPRFRDTNALAATHLPISIRARTVEIPLRNPAFFLAPVIGLIDRGHVRWKTLRTEIALLRLGDASIACLPGEIYPELVNGGVEKLPGGDFPVDPIEIPPIRELMPGDPKFIFGLANDEIGYIIPKSEWDWDPPYLYHSEKPVYGEINSVGPDTARLIHEAMRRLCEPSGQARGVESPKF
jgi:hypothetical protein